jgi:hypothetical protein
VTIVGTNFGSTTFNGALDTVQSWGANSIAVIVPMTATSGKIVVALRVVTSNDWPFAVMPIKPHIRLNGQVITIENN